MTLLPLFMALFVPAFASGQEEDKSVFRSPPRGLSLKIPEGWAADEASKQARVILRLNLPGEAAVKPEILVFDVPLGEPVTLNQYKELLRQYIQRAYKEPLMIEDRAVQAGGRPGFVLGVESKDMNGGEVVSWRGVFELSPRRLLGVDGVFPKGREEALGKAYTALLDSIRFSPRVLVAEIQAGLQEYAGALREVAEKEKKEPLPARRDEMDIFAGADKIGVYEVGLNPGVRGDVPGLEVDIHLRTNFGAEGTAEKRVRGFLSDDLKTQQAETWMIRTGKDKRTLYYTEDAAISGGEIRAERRINGERSCAAFPAPEGAVLAELSEALLARLLAAGKRRVIVPAAVSFENEPAYLKMELGGLHRMRSEDGTMSDVHVSQVLREDGTLWNYWHDGGTRLRRVQQGSLNYRRRAD